MRLADVSYGMDSVKNVRKIAEHNAPVPKIAVHGDEPHVVLSAAEDGMVYQTDIRDNRCKKLLKVGDVDNPRRLFCEHRLLNSSPDQLTFITNEVKYKASYSSIFNEEYTCKRMLI